MITISSIIAAKQRYPRMLIFATSLAVHLHAST